MPERDLVFFSYNHTDSRWLEPIRSAIEPYVLDEKLKVWSDHQIEVGNRWNNEIQDALAKTRVAVLLLSQRFFASKYIREKELPRRSILIIKVRLRSDSHGTTLSNRWR
jgi:hypothetical protein